MTTQPTAPPATDLELIEALDFDPQVPCSNQPPFHAGDEPAMYGIREVCCPTGALHPTCMSCWERMGTYPLWQCKACGRMALGRDRAYVIVTVIGGPR